MLRPLTVSLMVPYTPQCVEECVNRVLGGQGDYHGLLRGRARACIIWTTSNPHASVYKNVLWALNGDLDGH